MRSTIQALFNDVAGHTRRKIGGIYAVLLVFNLSAWVWAFVAFRHYPALVGTAFLAYSLGLRHAVDADHIAAIDNVTRKLMQEGKRPVAVGFMFSLGHSTVVVLGSAAIAATALSLQHRMDAVRHIGGLVGTLTSTLFLFGIAIVNLVVLRSVYLAFRRVRRGERYVEEDFDLLLGSRGFLSRLFRPSLSLWSILVFPTLFAAGMSLVDTTDNILMLGAYGWAFVKPIRKLYYNMTITLVSALVALVVGGIEALGLLAGQFHRQGMFWDVVGKLNKNFGTLGYCIVALFALCWCVSIWVYKWRRFDDLELEV